MPLFSLDKKDAVFHELGHAINQNVNPKLTKVIAFLKHKFPIYAIPTVLVSSLFVNNSKKPESQGFLYKIRKIVKDNILLVSLAIGVPKLIEEGMASINGIKFAKGKITAEQLKNLKIRSLKAWSTYGFSALVTALALKGGVMVCDYIQKNMQLRKQNKNQLA